MSARARADLDAGLKSARDDIARGGTGGKPFKVADPRARSGKHLHAGVLVRAPDAEREAWARAAALERLDRGAWIRQTLAKETRHLFGITFRLEDLTPDPDDGGAMAGPPNGTRRKKKDRAKKG